MHDLARNTGLHRIKVVGGCVIAPSQKDERGVLRMDFDPRPLLGPERGRRLDPLSQLAVVAVEHARRQAGLHSGNGDGKRSQEGIVVGTAFGALTTTLRYARRLITAGPATTNPIDFPDSIDGAPAAHIALELSLAGPSLTFVDGASSAMAALVHAARVIAWGRAKRMHIVVGDYLDDTIASAVVADRDFYTDGPAERPILAECLLAMVLEADGLRSPSDACVELVGHLRSPGVSAPENEGQCDVERVSHELSSTAGPLRWYLNDDASLRLARDSNGQGRHLVDASGAFELAGAWLGANGPSDSPTGAPDFAAPAPIAARVGCGSRTHPYLGFVRSRGS